MADYYTQAVIPDSFFLTPATIYALKIMGATVDKDGTTENVLEAMARSREPLWRYEIYFEENCALGSGINLGDELNYRGNADTIESLIELHGSQFVEQVQHLLNLNEPEFLHEVLKLNPDKELIEIQIVYTCSKMRDDGFSGCSYVVNRRGWMCISTTSFHINENGEIESDSEFHYWDAAIQPKTQKASEAQA